MGWESLEREINLVASASESLPAVIIIHDIIGKVVWMSERGLKQLNTSVQELRAISADEYYRRWFNEEDSKDYVPKIMGMLQRNENDEIITYFQQVRINGGIKPTWHMCSTRIFMRDEHRQPLYTITMAFPIDNMHHMAAKAERILAENDFLRKNYKSYSLLSEREREVLKELALGKTSAETAEELFISLSTVDTHRKNIRKKLGTSSYFELCQYARAFDLI